MKRIFLILFFLGVSDAQQGIAFRGITEDLRKVMENPEIRSGSEEPLIPVNIILKEKADFEELYRATQGVHKRIRRAVVWEEIQRVANKSQASLRAYLREKEGEGKVKDMKILWTANGINAQVEKSIIEEIWNRFPEIRSMDWDEIRPLEEVMDYRIRPETSSGSEFGLRNSATRNPQSTIHTPPPDTAWGVKKINAPLVWAMGYTGTGIIVGNIDTGTNYNHVDLADHLWDGDTTYPNHGWDFISNDNDPMDQSGHGTSTAGIVCGDGTAGFLTGVAPDAILMILRAGGSESSIWQSMDFCIANGADIITSSLSWKLPFNPDYETWRDHTVAERVAGIVHSNSIGNNGANQGPHPIPYNIATPGNCPPAWLHPDQTLIGLLSSTMGCGAVNQSDQIMSYSGRGPAAWENGPIYTDYPYNGGAQMGLLKPDVSAPTNVPTTSLSCNSCYTMSFGGTSAATPHLGGAMALLLSADTSLTPGDVTRIIQLTALDLGAPGKDNEYGAGRIDIYRAVLSLQRSNIILSDYSIDDSSGDNDMRAEPGETVNLFVTLQNGEPWQDATGVSAILRTDDTTLTLIDSLSNFGSIPSGGSADNLSDPFTFTVNPSNPHWAIFTIEINATPPSLNATETILLLIGHPDIILIDDDGGVDLESYYKEPLDNLGYVYDEWVVASQGVPPSAGTYGLQDHAVVIWFTGNDFTTLTPADTTVLRDFLQNGGKLFITSQNLGEEIGSDPFYSDFLRAQFLDANANDNLLTGVTGDPIGDGISLVIQGVNGASNADSEDRITPLPGADSVFSYTNALGTAALKYDSGVYKVVYFAFPFEAIHGAGSFASRDTVMARILKWFDLSVGIEEPDSGAFRKPYSEFRLFQNHPNPFHSTTLIHYALPAIRKDKTHVRLAVYDITGRLVETLVNQVQEPGVYTVQWKGTNLSSGVYFYRLTRSGLTSTKKLILMK